MLAVSANILQPLIDVFEAILVFFHDNVGLGWGLSIVALTIVRPRALLLPLTLKQFRSMQAMQRLAPQIKALQEKYKDDKQRQQQEMMKFYRENKVNPLASCLPLVAAAAGLHLAVLHAAHGPQARHLPGRSAIARARPNQMPRAGRRRGVGAVPLHPGPDGQGDRRRAGRADRPLRRLAAASSLLMSGDGGPEPAA